MLICKISERAYLADRELIRNVKLTLHKNSYVYSHKDWRFIDEINFTWMLFIAIYVLVSNYI